MKSHEELRGAALLLSALALASAPHVVLAQDGACETNDDCEQGYACEAVASGDCPAIACAPDEPNCEQPTCDTAEEASVCVPRHDCEADSDCIAGWVCSSQTIEVCAGAEPACPRDEPCDEKPEPTCTTRQETYCAAPWALPCQTAGDCGPGFECVEAIAHSCRGSSGGGSDAPTPSDDGGSSGFAPPQEDRPEPTPDGGTSEPECTSEPTGEYYCRLIETPCNSDADCDEGLSCQAGGWDSACAGGGTDDGGSNSGNGSGEADGGSDSEADARRIPACEPVEPTRYCAPPEYYSGYVFTQGGVERGDSIGTVGGGSSGVDERPAAGEDGDGSETAAPPSDLSAGQSGDGDDDDGCSASGARSASGSALLMALSVLGLFVRRRGLRA